MRICLRIARVTVGLMVLLVLGGCTGFAFLFGDSSISPRTDLIGDWTIASTSGAADVTGYKALHFLANDTFTITNESDEVIESNDMTEVTAESFVGDITLQTVDPDLVGQSTYAEYEISTWKDATFLRITFYDDDTKAARFVTFVCEKQTV